jgi:hypothetical protein
MRSIILKSLCLLTGLGMCTRLAHAIDCLPNAPTGWEAAFKMASLTNNPANQFAQWVGYVGGNLTISHADSWAAHSETFSSAGNSQLFDVRMAKLCDQCFATQPFDIDQADKLGLTLTKTTYTGILPPPGVPNPSYIATMILESWGGGRYTFQLTDIHSSLLAMQQPASCTGPLTATLMWRLRLEKRSPLPGKRQPRRLIQPN